MDSSIVMGIDIGGSHITTALVDLKKRSIIKGSLQRESVNSKGQLDEILTSWSDTIIKSFETNKNVIKRIGIAMPGPFDYENGICYMKEVDKFEALYGLNIKNLLSEKLSIEPCNIYMTNDAACFLRGEVFAGAAQGYDNAIAVTLGTGLGTARYKNGFAEDANLWCTPFQNSVAEEWLSTRWFLNRYTTLTGKIVKNVKELVDMYSVEHEIVQIFEEFAASLSSFLALFIKMDSPKIIVIGGNIAKSNHLFLNKVKAHLKEAGHHELIKLAILGEDAAILGASTLLKSIDVISGETIK